MKLLVKYRLHSEEWAVIYLFNNILRLLKETYSEIEFTYVPVIEFPYYEGIPRHGSLVIENPVNNKTIVLSYDDVPKDIIKQIEGTGWIVSNIQQMFCVSNVAEMRERKDYYAEISNIDVDKVIKPFSYTVYRTEFDLTYVDKMYAAKKSAEYRKQGMLFRGLFYGEREYYHRNSKHPEIVCTNADYKNLPEYVSELVEYRCGLSFTGAAEICHRDLEYFALGIPVIRPELKNSVFIDPLIPDYHYIGVQGPWYEEKMNAINKKWDEVKNDYEFLDFIGNNAREWYLKNGRLEIQANLFVNSIDLNLIIN